MGLKILNARILNEDTPEFFSELLEKGVDAVVEVPDLYSPCCLHSFCKFTHRKDNQYKCVKCGKVWIIKWEENRMEEEFILSKKRI